MSPRRANICFLLAAWMSFFSATVVSHAGQGKSSSNPATPSFAVPWSRMPPGGLSPGDVPQFVAVTFDDNFGPASSSASGGIYTILDFFKTRKNPAGAGGSGTFDGQPIRSTFYYNSIYLIDASQKVLGGKPGEDHEGRVRKAWSAALAAGHEAGDHTVNHFNGGVVPLDPDDCCRPRDFTVQEWEAEIGACRDDLTGAGGIGVKPGDVIGFRAPYLATNDAMLTALSNLHFVYDTSLPNCFDDAENGANCSWPYTLDQGSPDIDVLLRKFPDPDKPIRFTIVTAHPGLWEIPPTTLIVPPDDLASRYGFKPGLRDRISKKGELPFPSIYEASSGKIAGLDYTLLMDAGLSGDEMAAVLKYNLDLHISGNRAPLVFVAHSHLYMYSTPEDNPDTPTAADRDARWKGLTDFITYALSKPETRMVSSREILQWMQKAGVRKAMSQDRR